MEYAYQGKSDGRIARARLTGVNASYKDLCEVCRNVRRKPTDEAIEFLTLASKKKQVIYFARHAKHKGHRRELGGKKGGWPVKSAKIVLSVLSSAAANAARQNLGETRVEHILANKQDTFPRMSPKGRRIRQDFETAFVEVVLKEIREKPVDKAKPAVKKVEQKSAARQASPSMNAGQPVQNAAGKEGKKAIAV